MGRYLPGISGFAGIFFPVGRVGPGPVALAESSTTSMGLRPELGDTWLRNLETG